jgi:acyl-CoA thioester hydrolase
MTSYEKKIEIRWADLDPNFHLLHSKYYDIAAFIRMSFMVENGLTPAVFMKLHFGPIIFREEGIFFREINFGDKVTANIKLQKVTDDYRKWTIVTEIFKNTDTLAATVTVDGAWMDTAARKITTMPAEWIHLFEKAPKADNFTIG